MIRPLHANQPETSPELVRQLLAAQFPMWARRPIRWISSGGTTNAIYRVGDDLTVRLPLVAYGEAAIAVEDRWLPFLGARLPLEVPVQVGIGVPGGGYPFRWSVHRWLPGASAARTPPADLEEAARALAVWLDALHGIETDGAPDGAALGLRSAPLSRFDTATRRGLRTLSDDVDTGVALDVWEQSLALPRWNRDPVWTHGDLLSGNVLVRDGRLAAVIDFAGVGVGDPACDLMIAWSLLDRRGRAVLRERVDLDAATWGRARGHVVHHAAVFVPYYRDAAPAICDGVLHMLRSVLSEHAEGDGG